MKTPDCAALAHFTSRALHIQMLLEAPYGLETTLNNTRVHVDALLIDLFAKDPQSAARLLSLS